MKESDFYPAVRQYCGVLPASFEEIPAGRKATLLKLADYIFGKRSAGQAVQVTVICNHNSRRSHMGQLWLLTAAAWYGIDGVYSFSGGTEATAFHPNAVPALIVLVRVAVWLRRQYYEGLPTKRSFRVFSLKDLYHMKKILFIFSLFAFAACGEKAAEKSVICETTLETALQCAKNETGQTREQFLDRLAGVWTLRASQCGFCLNRDCIEIPEGQGEQLEFSRDSLLRITTPTGIQVTTTFDLKEIEGRWFVQGKEEETLPALSVYCDSIAMQDNRAFDGPVLIYKKMK